VHFLGHGSDEFISIVLQHGLRKVHGVLVGQGGGVCQWVVLVLSEVIEERCSTGSLVPYLWKFGNPNLYRTWILR
jgi:hypothetical protein